jgi:hypothetical protein
MVRMRTVKQCMEHLRQEDPESCISEHYLRGLVKQNKVPVFHAGKKQLINLDKLVEYLRVSRQNKSLSRINTDASVRLVSRW